MNYAQRKTMSLEEFLVWEDAQELRYEFDGFQPVAMTGGTAAHAAILRNLAISIGGRLKGKACKFFGSELKIEVVGRIRYPDGFVICSPVANDVKVIHDPVVIFEVSSESSARIDLFIKNREYAATPSVQRYVILSQNEIAGTMFHRETGDWIGHLISPEDVLSMPEIGIGLPFAELYDGLDFPVIEEKAQNLV